jgi:hypothetical protein
MEGGGKDISEGKSRAKTFAATNGLNEKGGYWTLKRGSTRPHRVENWLWKWLWTRKTGCCMN